MLRPGRNHREWAVCQVLILLFIGLLTPFASSLAQQYAFRTFGEGQVPKVGDAHGMLQDSRGVIWIWGTRGITSYDGARFEHFTTDDGLPSDYVYTIHETAQGQLLVSTYEGLIRLDPVSKSIATILRFPTHPVRDALWADGKLFLATDGGVMYHDDRGSFLVASIYDDKDSTAAVNYMAQQLAYDPATHTLWAATDRVGLVEIKIDSLPPLFELKPGIGRPSDIHRSSIAFRREIRMKLDHLQDYAIQDSAERIRRWKGASRIHVNGPADTIWPTYGLFFDHDRAVPVIWDHLHAYAFRDGRFERLTHFNSPATLFGVNHLPDDSYSYSRGNGLFLGGGVNAPRFNNRNGLTGINFVAHLVDHQGIQWVLDKQSNLNRLISPALKLYYSPHYSGLHTITRIEPQPDGSLLIASSEGISRLRNGNLTSLVDFNTLESQFLDFGVDPKGNFLIASASRLYLFDTRTRILRPIGPSHPANDGNVNFAHDGDGNLWFLLFGHIQFWDGNRLRTHEADDITGGLFIDALNDGRVLVGQWPWLLEYMNNRKRFYAQYDVLEKRRVPLPGSSKGVTASAVDLPDSLLDDSFAARFGALGPDSAYWVGTFNAGIVRLRRFDDLERTVDSLQVFDKRNGLPSNSVTALNRDERGNLYFTLQDGVFAVTHDGTKLYFPKLPPEATRFDFLRSRDGKLISATSHGLFIQDGARRYAINGASGLPENAVYKVSSLPSGELLAQQGNGFFLLDLDNLAEHIRAGGKPLITSLQGDGTNLHPARELVLRTAKREFRAYLALPDYFNEVANQYAWELEGFDDEFRPFSHLSQVEYTNLPPGHFSLNVKAVNGMSDTSLIAEPLVIHVIPRFYETHLFLVFVILSLIAGMVILLRWVVHRQRIRQEEILRVEKEKLQVASRMAASVAHEFNNPLQIILSAYELIRNHEMDEAKRLHYLDRIPHQVSRMKKLIEKLLTMREIREVDYAAGTKIIDLHRETPPEKRSEKQSGESASPSTSDR